MITCHHLGQSLTATCNHQGLGIRVLLMRILESAIVSYGNVQVQTHFMLFQGCIFSFKVHHCILWKCSGPNPFHSISGLYIFIQSTVCTHCLWTQFYNYRTIQEAQLEFGTCEQLVCTLFKLLSKHLKFWQICRHQSSNLQFVW